MNNRDKKYHFRKSLKRHLLEMAMMLVVFGPLTLYFTCSGCFDDWEIATVSTLFSGFMWIFLWKGNELGAHLLDFQFDWFANPLKRLIISILFTVFYTSLSVMVLHYLFFGIYLERDFYDFFIADLWDQLKFPLIITFIVSTFLHSRRFLFAWRQTAVDVERLKREQLSSKYESLKKQVNPHFLFNSLNALASLVHNDADLSERFIKKLSEVYRYVLDSQEKEVVPLGEELAFTEAYIFLQKIRHGDNLLIDIKIGEEELGKQVPPLALQMLVENAIKHNIISTAKPLRIRMFSGQDQVTVSNNLQERIDHENSSGLGINNIKMRYEYLSDQKISILKDADRFSATIPLLTLTI